MLPVHMAALNGYIDCVGRLMEACHGLDIDTPDAFGRTCLHAAACAGYFIITPLECNISNAKKFKWSPVL